MHTEKRAINKQNIKMQNTLIYERNKNTRSSPITKGRCYKILSLLPGEQKVDTSCDFPNKLMATGARRHCKIPDGAAALIGDTSMGDEVPVLSTKKNKKIKESA